MKLNNQSATPLQIKVANGVIKRKSFVLFPANTLWYDSTTRGDIVRWKKAPRNDNSSLCHLKYRMKNKHMSTWLAGTLIDSPPFLWYYSEVEINEYAYTLPTNTFHSAMFCYEFLFCCFHQKLFPSTVIFSFCSHLSATIKFYWSRAYCIFRQQPDGVSWLMR